MEIITLYLLRHGESVANADRVFASRRINPPLSDVGVQQIMTQAESLKDIEFSAMYASPLLRARQTAEIVRQQCGLELMLSDHLYEVDVGVLDGEDQDDPRNWEDFMDVIRKWEQDLASVGFPGGETLNDVGDRFKRFLDGLESKQQEPILVVGHCLLFMAVIWLFCKNRGSKFEDGYMGRGHLSVISGTSDKFRLLKFNIPPAGDRSGVS